MGSEMCIRDSHDVSWQRLCVGLVLVLGHDDYFLPSVCSLAKVTSGRNSYGIGSYMSPEAKVGTVGIVGAHSGSEPHGAVFQDLTLQALQGVFLIASAKVGMCLTFSCLTLHQHEQSWQTSRGLCAARCPVLSSLASQHNCSRRHRWQ